MNSRWLRHAALAALLGASAVSYVCTPAEAADPTVPVRVVTQVKGGILEISVTWADKTSPIFKSEYSSGAARITIDGASLKGSTQVIPLEGNNAKEALVSQVDDETVVVNIRAENEPHIKVFQIPTVKNVQGVKYVLPINLLSTKSAAATKADDKKPAAAAKADDKKPAVTPKADNKKPVAAPKADDKKPAAAAKADDKKPAAATKADDKKPVAAPKADDKKTAVKKAENVRKAETKPAPPQLTAKDDPVKVKVIFNPKAEELRIGLIYKGNLKNVVKRAKGDNSTMSIELCPATLQGPTQSAKLERGQVISYQAKQAAANKVIIEVKVQNPPYFVQDVDAHGGAFYGISYNYAQDYKPTATKPAAAPKADNKKPATAPKADDKKPAAALKADDKKPATAPKADDKKPATAPKAEASQPATIPAETSVTKESGTVVKDHYAYFPLKERSAATVAASLIKLYPNVDFKVDEMLNVIFVQGSAEDVAKIGNVLKVVSNFEK